MFLSINADAIKHSVPYFMQENAFFLAQNPAVSSRLREMEDEYGILPYPKYDGAQAGYFSSPCCMSLYMAIPVTDNDTERAVVIVNALSYESYSSDQSFRNILKLTLPKKTCGMTLLWKCLILYVKAGSST